VKVGIYTIREYWTLGKDRVSVRKYWAAEAFGLQRRLFPFTDEGKARAIAWAQEN